MSEIIIIVCPIFWNKYWKNVIAKWLLDKGVIKWQGNVLLI